MIQKPQVAEPTSQQGYQHSPMMWLTANERATLRGLAKTLTALCDLIFPIGEGYEERLAAELKQRHHSAYDDNYHRQEYPSTDISRNEDDILVGCQPTIECDNPSIRGERGRSGDNPIDAITYDLKELIDKITKLCGRGIPQTISDHSTPEVIRRLSDDGSIRERTEISTAPNTTHCQHKDILHAREAARRALEASLSPGFRNAEH